MRLLSARGICNRSFCSPLLNRCEGQSSIVQTNVSETGIQEEERFYQKGHSIKNHFISALDHVSQLHQETTLWSWRLGGVRGHQEIHERRHRA